MAGEYELDPGTQIGEDGLRGSTLREQPPAARIGHSIGALTLPIYHQVALDLHPSMLYISKFGKNSDIDAASTPEDIWDSGGLYTGFSTAAETLSVVSAHADDTNISGAGAWTVELQGLDVNFNIISETVTLNGTTPVVTTLPFIRCNRAIVRTAGANSENTGIISVTQSTSGDLHATIDALHGQTAIAAYTVPNGYTGLLIFTHVLTTLTTGGNAAAEVDLRIRPEGAAWRSIENNFVSNGAPLVFDHTFPPVLASRTDAVVRCHQASANNISISATFDILLIPDELL